MNPSQRRKTRTKLKGLMEDQIQERTLTFHGLAAQKKVNKTAMAKEFRKMLRLQILSEKIKFIEKPGKRVLELKRIEKLEELIKEMKINPESEVDSLIREDITLNRIVKPKGIVDKGIRLLSRSVGNIQNKHQGKIKKKYQDIKALKEAVEADFEVLRKRMTPK